MISLDTRWIKRFKENGVAERKKQCWSVRTRRDEADLVVDYICGIPVNQEKLDQVNVSYKSINNRLKFRYEQLCSGAIEPNENHKSILKNIL